MTSANTLLHVLLAILLSVTALAAEQPLEGEGKVALAGKYQGVKEYLLNGYEFNSDSYREFYAGILKVEGKFNTRTKERLTFVASAEQSTQALLKIKPNGFAIGHLTDQEEDLITFEKVDRFWWEGAAIHNYIGTWQGAASGKIEFFEDAGKLILAVPARTDGVQSAFYNCKLENGVIQSHCISEQAPTEVNKHFYAFNNIEKQIYVFGLPSTEEVISTEILQKFNLN